MSKIIDVHAHVYPDKIANVAVQSVSDFYNIKMAGGKGSVSDYLQHQAEAKIDLSIVHSVAVKPQNVESINSFIAETVANHPTLVGFATMHPDYANFDAEIARVGSLGLKGFKLHPDFQKVYVDSDRMLEFFSKIAGKYPVILHCGDYRYDYDHPQRIKRVLNDLPNLVVNAAHFGGWSVYDLALEYLEHENCYLDVSSASVYLGPRRTTELIRLYGVNRILFGSDYPMWNPQTEVERFMQNDLSKNEQEQVLHLNAERFLSNAF